MPLPARGTRPNNDKKSVIHVKPGGPSAGFFVDESLYSFSSAAIWDSAITDRKGRALWTGAGSSLPGGCGEPNNGQ